ncbi:MAG: FlgD immunoglobulin-like domain containing protein [Microcystaceae cyanobacterium]
MNRPLVYLSLLLLNLLSFHPSTQANDKDCQPGNSKNTAYMRRENDSRCEGITTPSAAGSDFRISSFAIGQLQPTEKLTLKIPKIANLSEPDVLVQSSQKYYQLIPLQLKPQGQQWQFQWSNNILAEENIALNQLRTTASSDNILIPVRLSNNSAYDIRVYTGDPSKTITLKIQQKNCQEIYSQTLSNQPNKEVKFLWNGKTKQGKIVPSGRYILSINAVLETNNGDQTKTLTQQFEHNPAWLK